MKNAINYYYNLYPDNIFIKDNKYRFIVGSDYYVLMPFLRDKKEIELIYQTITEILKNGVYTHQIVLNNDSNLLTNIDNTNYVLFKAYSFMDEVITIKDIETFTSIMENIRNIQLPKNDDWGILWSYKIDYFEYQVSQLGMDYPLIKESFNYFIGMSENGISAYNNYKMKDSTLVISHKRIKRNDTLFDLYNPINYVLDLKIRDLCEYFKDYFIKEKNIYDLFINTIKNKDYTKYEYTMIFIRMLYPSFYFDKYEKIIENNEEENKIKEVLKLVDDYEAFLNKLYNYLIFYTSLPEIEWIKKM